MATSDDDSLAWLAFRSLQGVDDYYCFKVDIVTVPTESKLLDEFFSTPPSTKVQMRIRKPDALIHIVPSGGKWEGDFRLFVTTRAEGVYLREMVAEVADAGPEWLRHVHTLGVDGVIFQNERVVSLSKVVHDFVDRQRTMHDPDEDEDD